MTKNINWDHNVVDYDLDRFPWYERILSVIQEVKPQCKSIRRLHEFFDRTEIVPLRKKVEQFVRTKEFSGWVDDYFHHIIRESMTDYLIQATPTLNFVLPDQQKQGSLLTFHTGHLTAYSNGMRTIWTPVSTAFGSNSMQVVSREDSKKLTKEFMSEKLSMKEMQKRCSEVSYPVDIKLGQAWLFDQDHWHGNINNDTGITRIGLDIRVMEQGTDYGYRKPGSYFRFLGDTVEVPKVDTDRRWIVFNDPAATQYLGTMPFYIARSFIENYVDRLGIKPVGWHNEYTLTDWNPHLEFFINETEVQGIALLSMHGLSSPINRRQELLELCLEKDIHILFCDENFLLKSKEGLDYIKKCLEF
jgi:hypothetical protein